MRVTEGSDAQVIGEQVEVVPGASRVTINNSGDSDMDVVVPAGVHLHIQTDSGAVTVSVPHAALDIQSDSGQVTADITGDPTIQADSDSGDTSARGFDGDDRSSGHAVTHIGSGADAQLKVKVHTDSGDITLRELQPTGLK